MSPATPPISLALLLALDRERDVLVRWLRDIGSVCVVEDDAALTEAGGFDMVITDGIMLGRHQAAIEALRERQQPVYLPILLLAGEREWSHAVQTRRPLVDDVIRVPTSEATLRMRIEVALEARRLSLALAASTRFERRLAGIVGHDIRTPLSVMSAVGQLLSSADAQLPPGLRGLGPRVDRCVASISQLAEDLLVVASGRSEAGLHINLRAVDIRQVIDDSLATLRDASRVRVAIEGDSAATLDALRVRQLLVNLLQNALRHGGREVPIEVVCDGRDPDVLSIAVSNAGRLEPGQLSYLFDPGIKGDSTTEGFGLGLYIVRLIAEGHGGRVEGISHEGRVTFTVTLPRQPQAASQAAPAG